MHEALRNLLLLALAGCLVTVAGSAAAWWRDEERRLRRYLRAALGGPPESVIIAPGRGRGAGLNLEQGRIAVLWDGGVKGLIYRLNQLVGAELILDDQVAARAYRGEPRRALDQAPSSAHRVSLRLIFDNPRDPDFELELWPPTDTSKRERATAGQAITTCRRWISGVEAILRQPAPSRALDSERGQDLELELEPDPEPLEVAPPSAAPVARLPAPARPKSTIQGDMFAETPPWDEDDDEDVDD
ncbi:MAG TPA: hypothetical protein VMU59_03715 [Caulobacteraceae bacterium]|nr:hypothetical protein [Caulobacteraceae bacterium]